jgi:hypothetical protein
MRQVTQAFALVLVALVGVKVAASLVDVAIGPIAVLLGLILIFMWLFTGHDR